jgi:TPR repeat protein
MERRVDVASRQNHHRAVLRLDLACEKDSKRGSAAWLDDELMMLTSPAHCSFDFDFADRKGGDASLTKDAEGDRRYARSLEGVA